MVAGGFVNDIFELTNGLIGMTLIWDKLAKKETVLKKGGQADRWIMKLAQKDQPKNAGIFRFHLVAFGGLIFMPGPPFITTDFRMIRITSVFFSLIQLCVLPLLTYGQAATPSVEPQVIKLWKATPPGPASKTNGPEKDLSGPNGNLVAGEKVIRLGNVSSPEIHVYKPKKELANGAAVVICPGGGFTILAWDLEGTEVAEWFNSIGVTAVLLKYRVPTGYLGSPGKWEGPVIDTQRAISMARQNAEKWGIDRERIGVLGFSAGGETAAMTSIKNGKRLYDAIDRADEQSCAPNFAALIYPGGIVNKEGTRLQKEYIVNAQTPPTFFAHAANDPVKCEASVLLFLALKRAKVKSELHIYHDGGHGYGLRKTKKRVTEWPADLKSWLTDLGFLSSKTASIGTSPAWKKHTINDQSPFEAAGVGDLNNDGKPDVFSGDSWYEAPKWTRHQIRDVAAGTNPHYYEDFADCPIDVNGDGKLDIVTCAYFSRQISWVEQGKNPTERWTEHLIDKPGPMETGELVDINGDGRKDFLPNIGGEVAWYELTQTSPVQWKKHSLGRTGAGHGVGVGDINRDGRLDIISPKGWFEQPKNPQEDQWMFHPEFELGAAGIMILGRDFDGDGDTDIVWGMGHTHGLFWLRQDKPVNGKRTWVRDRIDTSFSQVHTLLLADLDGDGIEEVVTGKRVYAHEVEPGDTDPSCIYSYQFDTSKSKWAKKIVYEGKPAKKSTPKAAKNRWALKDFERGTAGTGLQMVARDMDMDGDLDLVCPGKSGLYWFENRAK